MEGLGPSFPPTPSLVWSRVGDLNGHGLPIISHTFLLSLSSTTWDPLGPLAVMPDKSSALFRFVGERRRRGRWKPLDIGHYGAPSSGHGQSGKFSFQFKKKKKWGTLSLSRHSLSQVLPIISHTFLLSLSSTTWDPLDYSSAGSGYETFGLAPPFPPQGRHPLLPSGRPKSHKKAKHCGQ